MKKASYVITIEGTDEYMIDKMHEHIQNLGIKENISDRQAVITWVHQCGEIEESDSD